MDFSDHEDPDDDRPSETPTPRGGGGKPRYRECLKNHAVTIGGHAVDGCGEFMPAGDEGTIDSLRCAACGCHRNFHRKELPGISSPSSALVLSSQDHHSFHHPHHFGQQRQYYRSPAGYLHQHGGGPHGFGYRPPHPVPPASAPLALPSTSGGREEEEVGMSGDHPMEYQVPGGVRLPGGPAGAAAEGSSGGGSGKKRFRTKFTQEQKVRMLEFAEKVGWRIQKHDEAAVAEFCNETGLKRHVLKVWMHNNKHTLGKKVLLPPPPP